MRDRRSPSSRRTCRQSPGVASAAPQSASRRGFASVYGFSVSAHPGIPSGVTPRPAHSPPISADFRKELRYAVLHQHIRHAVGGMAFGDRGQVECHTAGLKQHLPLRCDAGPCRRPSQAGGRNASPRPPRLVLLSEGRFPNRLRPCSRTSPALVHEITIICRSFLFANRFHLRSGPGRSALPAIHDGSTLPFERFCVVAGYRLSPGT